MPISQRSRMGNRAVAAILAAAVGIACASLVGLAVAKSFTLRVASHARVTNTKGVTKHEAIAVTSNGSAVYTLSGETTHHILCVKQSGCFAVWPPVKVSSKKVTKAPGIKGKLGTFKRNGFRQLTLNGHPLYRFQPDTAKGVATGEGINHFGGVWHVVKASSKHTNGGTTCLYPPC